MVFYIRLLFLFSFTDESLKLSKVHGRSGINDGTKMRAFIVLFSSYKLNKNYYLFLNFSLSTIKALILGD